MLWTPRIVNYTGFKEFDSAQRTLAGIEVVNVILKDQIIDAKNTPFKTFLSVAA
jgi:putative transposase